jgi:Ras-related protein Rab-4B
MCCVDSNKSDRKTQREVPFAEAARFAQENDLLFMETSAVTGDCVDDV